MIDEKKPVKIQVEDLGLSFGGVMALDGVSLDIRENEILAIIGPNGAGKTAFLNCINGFYRPQKGEIYYKGEKITRLRPDSWQSGVLQGPFRISNCIPA